jgi:hypothetical protein
MNKQMVASELVKIAKSLVGEDVDDMFGPGSGFRDLTMHTKKMH